MRVLGLDPGINGAYALWDGFDLIVMDVPACKSSGRGREVDWIELTDTFDVLFAEVDHAYIEKVGAGPKDGRTSAFNFGYTAGAQRMVVTVRKFPVTEVTPTVWKTSMGLSSDKKKSLALAKQMFPRHAHLFGRSKDDGRAEAALLAYYGRCKLLGEKPR